MNVLPQISKRNVHITPFLPAGHPLENHATLNDANIQQIARDWKMEVDLDEKLVLPTDIVITTLQKDMVL